MTGKIKLFAVLGVIVSLTLIGLVTGAIGANLMAGEGNEANPLLDAPSPHIPPQKIFVSAATSGGGDEGEEEHGGGGTGTLGVDDSNTFAVTNTLLSSWIVTLILIGLFYGATRRMSVTPTGLQNVMEAAVEALLNFVQSVAGPGNARRFFPLIATIFMFVMLNAWIGLLPIYPALGFLNADGELERHLLRPAGTDLNMPLALALVSFVFVEFWGFRLLKLSYLSKFIRLENLRKGNYAQVPIDLFVGVLELLSEFVRIISFTFRLFGNMTAGEILLLVITYLVPFVIVLPFYGLELLVGLVQALIFAGLTLVFVVVAVTPHSTEEHS